MKIVNSLGILLLLVCMSMKADFVLENQSKSILWYIHTQAAYPDASFLANLKTENLKAIAPAEAKTISVEVGNILIFEHSKLTDIPKIWKINAKDAWGAHYIIREDIEENSLYLFERNESGLIAIPWLTSLEDQPLSSTSSCSSSTSAITLPYHQKKTVKTETKETKEQEKIN